MLVGINDTQIGSGDPADRNVIAGSVGFGVGFIGPNNSGMVVQGNFIGVGSDGVTPLGNGGDGVDIVGGFGNMIGGGARPWSNVIANNGGAGVNVRGSLRNAVLRNSIYSNGGLAQIHRRDDYAAAERAIGAREGDGPGTIWGRGGPVFVFSCRGETL